MTDGQVRRTHCMASTLHARFESSGLFPVGTPNVYTELLLSYVSGMHRLMGRIYEISVEMGSGAMIYIPSLINIGSEIQKLMGRIY
jgi:hypothetical protein